MSMLWITLGLHLSLVAVVMYSLKAVLVPPYLERNQRQAKRQWWLAGGMAFFLPFLGAIMLWLFQNRHRVPKAPSTTDVPVQQSPHHDFLDYFEYPERETDVESEKGDERLNALNIEHYLDLIMSSRELDPKRAIALLKEALGSKAENARLLAYALYSKKEQGLFKVLDGLLAQLNDGQMHNARLHLAIAQLYWHMLEIGLIDPAVAQDMWDKLRLHAALAAKYEPTLWQAFWLMAQASLQEHRDLQARELLKQALSVGADRGTLEPLMEEVRFRLSKAIVNQA
ncbi:MAG: hypothetical protein RI964_1389 [Pseudomonadota bacterium]|jgi:hypothetical protein